MHLDEVEHILRQSLEDDLISKNEKIVLSMVVEELSHEQLRFMRNKAFRIAREHIETGANVIIVMSWLEKLIKILDVPEDKPLIANAYFSPGDDCRERLIKLCRRANQSLDICVFTISDDHLTREIIRAYDRGVNVRIITDDAKSEDKGSDIYDMMGVGIQVRCDHDSAHMHHKFVIRDNELLVTGSFNWTRSATEKNQENLIVTNESKLVQQFSKRFDQLWEEYEGRHRKRW